MDVLKWIKQFLEGQKYSAWFLLVLIRPGIFFKLGSDY